MNKNAHHETATIAARALHAARKTRRPSEIVDAARVAIEAAVDAACSARTSAGRERWEKRADAYRAVLADWSDRPAPVIGRPRMQAEAASVTRSVAVTPTQADALTWLGRGNFRAGVRRAGDLAAEEMTREEAPR